MVYQVLLAILLLACLSSFAWAMRRFFVKPDRMTPGLRVTLGAGLVFAITHFYVILRTPVLKPLAVGTAITLYCLALGIFWWTISAHRVKPLAACFSPPQGSRDVQHATRHPRHATKARA